MVLGKLPVPGRPTILIIVGQGPTALAVGAGGGCLDIFTLIYLFSFSLSLGGWSGGAMVLGKLSVPGRPTIWIQWARAYCARSRCGWGLFGHFYSPLSFLSSSPSLWETARYRLKYCLKGPLNPNQPNNQPSLWETAQYRLKYCLKGPVNPKQPTNLDWNLLILICDCVFPLD